MSQWKVTIAGDSRSREGGAQAFFMEVLMTRVLSGDLKSNVRAEAAEVRLIRSQRPFRAVVPHLRAIDPLNTHPPTHAPTHASTHTQNAHASSYAHPTHTVHAYRV